MKTLYSSIFKMAWAAVILTWVLTSCGKDEDYVTLLANISPLNGAKAYIDADHYACWADADSVCINNLSYGLRVDGNECAIKDVYAADEYVAFYPMKIWTYETQLSASSITHVLLDAVQTYLPQHLPLVMAAYLGNGGTQLVFRNACIVLELKVTNTFAKAVRIGGVTVSDSDAPLCGMFNITNVATAPKLEFCGSKNAGEEHRKVTVKFDEGVDLEPQGTTSIYVVLPPTDQYPNNKFTIQVDAYDLQEARSGNAIVHYKFTQTQSANASGAFSRNRILPIDIALNSPEHTSTVDGLGTTQSPYTIASVEDLVQVQKLIDEGYSPVGLGGTFSMANYQLTADLVVTSTLRPIGTAANNFTGIFDGQGHTITFGDGAAIVGDYSAGIFGYMTQGAEVRNLTVDGNVALSTTATDQGVVGVVCGKCDRGVIDACRVSCSTVTVTNGAYVGLIAGEVSTPNQTPSVVQNCCVDNVSIQHTAGKGSHRIGGIAGNVKNGVVRNCYGLVTGNVGEAYAGCLVGQTQGAALMANCYVKQNSQPFGSTTHYADICAVMASSTRLVNCFFPNKLCAEGTMEQRNMVNVTQYTTYFIGGQQNRHMGAVLQEYAAAATGLLLWIYPTTDDEGLQSPELNYGL